MGQSKIHNRGLEKENRPAMRSSWQEEYRTAEKTEEAQFRVLLDWEKAFDKVPPRMMRLIAHIYDNPQLRVETQDYIRIS